LKRLSAIEEAELVDTLKKHGFSDVLEALYYENKTDHKVYTKKGRLNKSGACRAMDCKPKDLEETFKLCRKILGDDWNE